MFAPRITTWYELFKDHRYVTDYHFVGHQTAWFHKSLKTKEAVKSKARSHKRRVARALEELRNAKG